MYRQSTLRRLVCTVLLPCYLAACTSWRTQEVSPEQVLADEQPTSVQVTLTDGSRLVLEEPAVLRDTLSGSHDGTPVRIPLADVSSIAVKETDAVKTGFAVFGGLVLAAAVAAGVVYLVYCTGDDQIC